MGLYSNIKRAVCKAIKALIKVYGVQGDVYYPVKTYSSHSAIDYTTTIYNNEPDDTLPMLLVGVFGDKPLTIDFVDQLFLENNKLYLPCEIGTLPNNTKVVIEDPITGLKSEFYIKDKHRYIFQNMPVFDYYEITTIAEIQEVEDETDVIDTEAPEIPIEITEVEDSESSVINKQELDDELSTYDDLLNKRRVNRFKIKKD